VICALNVAACAVTSPIQSASASKSAFEGGVLVSIAKKLKGLGWVLLGLLAVAALSSLTGGIRSHRRRTGDCRDRLPGDGVSGR